MKEFTIDADIWRCGGYGRLRLGKGKTLLLNEQGSMCCLGQICEQSGIGKGALIGEDFPQHLSDSQHPKIPFLVHQEGALTDLSREAMRVNDKQELSLRTRVQMLRELFKKNNIKLKFKNIKKYL